MTTTADPSLQRDAERLYEALTDLIRVYQFRDRDRICCHDLSVTQCYALDVLVKDGPLTVNELAGRLYLDKSTASRVVDALERKGLLDRLTHPEDRRAVHLRATAGGETLRERISRSIQQGEMKLIEEFSPEVRSAMIELIRRLGTAAAHKIDTRGGTCCCID